MTTNTNKTKMKGKKKTPSPWHTAMEKLKQHRHVLKEAFKMLQDYSSLALLLHVLIAPVKWLQSYIYLVLQKVPEYPSNSYSSAGNEVTEQWH